ncbi:hypothetical protein BP5796_12818 [Coleophoma crateriformis]|uniref:Uncharacterized protein n=1 Tax=Coleophoma crateriformis TaxID=565419 RepID=A0A3D8Q6U5_9HELO|nr:hypothetical protein BP5796_12818 [Coleophoma crateriformis]
MPITYCRAGGESEGAAKPADWKSLRNHRHPRDTRRDFPGHYFEATPRERDKFIEELKKAGCTSLLDFRTSVATSGGVKVRRCNRAHCLFEPRTLRSTDQLLHGLFFSRSLPPSTYLSYRRISPSRNPIQAGHHPSLTMFVASRALVPSDLIMALTWIIGSLLLAIVISYLAGCYVLEVSTELVDDGQNERTNRLLFFRKGPVEFILGSYHNGRPVVESASTRTASTPYLDGE